MTDELDDYIKNAAKSVDDSRTKMFKARDLVRSKFQVDIPDDVVEDFYNTTGLESGRSHYNKNGSVKMSPPDPKDGQRAVGWSQIKPGTIRQYNLDPMDEIQNIAGGLRYFYDADPVDPVSRRIGYFSGHNSGAQKLYKKTGAIPKGGDFTGTSFDQYIQGTGGYKQIDDYIKGAKAPTGTQDSSIDDYIKKIHGEITPTVAAPAPNLPSLQKPVPESINTIEAQVQSATDVNSPRAGVLLTEPSQEKLLDPASIKLFKRVQTPQGTLLVNERKAKALGVVDYQKELPKIIGKVADVQDTSQGPAVLTTAPDGTELTASATPTPEIAQAQAAVDQAAHPGSVSKVVDAQDVVKQRQAPSPEQIAALAKKYAKPSNKTKAAPSTAFGHPVTERLTATEQDDPDGRLTATEQVMPHGAEGVLTDPGVPDEDPTADAPKTVPSLGSVPNDPKLSPEEMVRVAANKVLPQYGVKPEEIEAWIADAKNRGTLVAGNPNSPTFEVHQSMLDDIRANRVKQRAGEIAQTGVPQEQYDPEGTTFQKMRGLTPEEIKQENLESDPLYLEAKRNAPDDVEAEYLRLQSNEKLKTLEGEGNISNFGLNETGENLLSKFVSGAGNTADLGAGILHAINSIPHVTLIGDPNNESFTQWAEKKLRSQGKQLHAPGAKFDREHPGQSIVQQLLGMGAAATSDVPRIMALPGGAAVQFGGDALLQEVGRQGHVSTQALKSAASGAATGFLFHSAGVLGQNAKAGLLNAVLPKRIIDALAKDTISLSAKAQAALHAYGRGVSLGTITAGTAAQHLIEGGTPEEAFKSALHMALFDLAFNAKSDIKGLSGKIIKATDGNITKTLTIMPDGKIVELKKAPPKADVELDVREIINDVHKPTAPVEPETVLPKAETAQSEAQVTSKEADVSPELVAPKIVSHPNPAIDGKEVIAETADGKVVVPNPENKSGISVVKDFAITGETGQRGIGAARLKELRDEARRSAEVDTLTGLANRSALDKALPTAEADKNTSIIAFDANNFGKINKEVGQAEGDKALKDIGNAIKQAASEFDNTRVFRRGGDEFVVIANKDVADKIRARAEEIYGDKKYGSTNVSLTGTVGNTFEQADSLLQSAKTARKQNAPIPKPEGTDASRSTGNDKGVGRGPTGEGGGGGTAKAPSLSADNFKRSKVGLDIEAKTVADDLTKSFEGTAGYTPVTVKEQAQKAVDLVSKDLEKVRRIISGAEPVPDGLLAAPIIDAAERHARKTGDVELLKDLANSPLVSETSRHAQELRMLAERHPNSPVKLIREVQEAREAQAIRKGRKPERVKQEVIDAIQKEMKKVPKTPKSWADFVETLKC